MDVIADLLPVIVALSAKFAKVFKPSKLGSKGVPNTLEQIVKEGVDATNTIHALPLAI